MAHGTSPQEDNTSSKPKRRLRPAPVTVREQSEQAQARAAKPRPSRATLRFIGAPFRFVGRKVAVLGRFKFFRVVGYILVPPYFRNSWQELRNVTWPDRRQSIQLTMAVIIFSIIFGVIVAIVDFGLDKLFRKVILKL